jgi:hypothetical protein
MIGGLEIGFVIASEAKQSSIAPLDCFVAELVTWLSQQRIENEGSFLTGRSDRIALRIKAAFRRRILRRAWGGQAVRLRQLRPGRRNGRRPGRRFKRPSTAAGRKRQSGTD